MRTLKEIRTGQSMTRACLAARSGVCHTTIGRLEHPTWARKYYAYRRIDVDTAERLASALGVGVEDIAWPFQVAPVYVNGQSSLGPHRQHRSPENVKTCPSCYLVLPNTGICDDCS